MNAGWSARGDIGLDVLDRVQRGLNVGMIMSPRDDLMTCQKDETISAVTARNSMDYSFLPVVSDEGRYLGLFNAAAWFNRTAPERVIGDDFEPFSEALVIGADASIFEFVVTADERPTRLVVSRDKVAGLISISDLQQLPVRAALFTLITALEIAMAHRIETQWGDGEGAWKELLSVARRGAVEDKVAEVRRADETKQLTHGLQLSAFSKLCWFMRPEGWTMYDKYAQWGLARPNKSIGFKPFYNKLEKLNFIGVTTNMRNTIKASDLPDLWPERIIDKYLMQCGQTDTNDFSAVREQADYLAVQEGFFGSSFTRKIDKLTDQLLQVVENEPIFAVHNEPNPRQEQQK